MYTLHVRETPGRPRLVTAFCVALLLTSTGLAWVLVGVRRHVALDERVTPEGWSISLSVPQGWSMRTIGDGDARAIAWSRGPAGSGVEIILSHRDVDGIGSPALMCKWMFNLRGGSSSGDGLTAQVRDAVDVGPFRGAVLEVSRKGYAVAAGLDDSDRNRARYYTLELISNERLSGGILALFDQVVRSIERAGRREARGPARGGLTGARRPDRHAKGVVGIDRALHGYIG